MTVDVVDTYTRLHQQITDRGPWMQTYTGGAFFLADPHEREVKVADIAHALANTARYNGHTRELYSVAQHAVVISEWLEEDGWPLDVCYAGLHHDSAEAYTGDVPSYLKHIVPEFKIVERRVEAAVMDALGFHMADGVGAIIKNYDMIALATECRDILGPNRSEFTWGNMPSPRRGIVLVPWAPKLAENVFLDRHAELRRRMGP